MENINNLTSENIKVDSFTNDSIGNAGNLEAVSINDRYVVRKEYLILLMGTLLLGILSNILFFDSELGVSVPIFVIAFYSVLFLSFGNTLKFKASLPWALSIPVILLSFTYMFYSNMIFYVLNLMAIPLLIVVQTVLITGNNIFSWHTPCFLIDIIYGFFFRVFVFVIKPFKITACIFTKKGKSSGKRTIRKVLLGLLISVPLLFIVVSLLISADRIFESYMDRIPDMFAGIKVGEYIARGFIIIFIFVTSFSFIFSLAERKKPVTSIQGDGSIKLPKVWDSVVVMTIMILVNAIYLMFVIIQFAYLFGGVRLALPEDFTFSEYARRGFFELITVTIINFGMMMLFIGFTKLNGGAAGKFLRGLYSLLVGNTVIMLISAYYRMLLYEEAYGFTYLRVLSQSFMIFMLVIFGIMLFRIWKDGISLAKPFIITALAAFVIINYVNIDVIIARENIQRYYERDEIDVAYLSALSYDALPEIARLKVTNNKIVAEDAAALIKSKSEKALKNNDWQSFNLSRYKAGRARWQ